MVSKIQKELNEANTANRVPTGWLIIIPFVNIWWLWRYATAVEEFTKNRMSKVAAFLLVFLLGVIGQAIVQSRFNAEIRDNYSHLAARLRWAAQAQRNRAAHFYKISGRHLAA